jgi:hypothetical protein
VKKRSLSILLAMGLVLSLLVGALGTASAQPNGDDNDINGDEATSQVFFPWVANGSDADGTGPYYGTITLQNVHPGPNVLSIYVTDEDNGWVLADTIALQRFGSITLSADQLGVPEPGGAVWVEGWASMGTPGVEAGTVCVVTANIFGDLADLLDEIEEDEFADLVAALVAAGVGTTDVEVFFDISEELCDAIGTAPGVFSWWVTVGDDIPEIPAEFGAVAGVYKQVTGDSPVTNARTTSADDIVDGYTGLNGNQITTATNEYVVPIVQTNNRWNTQIRLTNFSNAGTTPYSITIYESGGSGALGPSVGSFTGSFAAGDTVTYNLLDEGFPEEFVGSAFIETNAPVGAVAERVKDFTDMLIMTTSRPVFQDAGDHVAPLVFQDWNFWNTGIATANTGDAAATVTYNYHPPLSGFTQDQRNIAPRAMEFVYRPGGQELGIGTVGAAILRSQQPHASTVDEVKYFGELPDVGHAMSYATVPWDDLATDGEGLALPLFQRGNPLNDTGDTSGIQLFNASADNSVTFEMTIYNTAGNPVAPTILQPITETLAPRANYTLYSHDLAELPVGFQGSVIIRVSGGGALGAVSNNVNYAVQFDGSAAFNLVNIPALPEVPEVPVTTLVPDEDDVEAVNPFYGDDTIVEAIAQALLDADTQYYAGATLDDVIDDITDDEGNLISEEEFIAFLAGEAITQAEADALVAAWLSVNQHTVNYTVLVDGVIDTEGEYEVVFTVAGANNFVTDPVEVVNGTVALTYNATQAGTDFINATIVDLDVDAPQVTKVWEPVEAPEPQGPGLDLVVLVDGVPVETIVGGTTVTSQATVVDAAGEAAEGIEVTFEYFVGDADTPGATGNGTTGADGVATHDQLIGQGAIGETVTVVASAEVDGVDVEDDYSFGVTAGDV